MGLSWKLPYPLTRIDREEQLKGEEITLEKLRLKYGTFQCRCVGLDRVGKKKYNSRVGIQTDLGDIEIQLWKDLVLRLAEKAGERALFQHLLERWAAHKGMNEICGPLGFNDLDREGLLVEGFREDSTFEEQYNYEYYGGLLERIGFCKDVDWVEYELRMPEKRNEMLDRVAKRAMEMNRLHIADTSLPKRKYTIC